MRTTSDTTNRRASRSERQPRNARLQQHTAGNGQAVSLSGVHLTYPGGTAALRDLTLEVADGEFVYLVGTSGSGKSSLLKLLYAEQRADSGRVWVAGANLSRMRPGRVPAFRRRLGVVFQDFKLLEGRTVHDQVSFALTVLGQRDQAAARVPHVLDIVGLADKADRLPTELSGGEQQRVALARALVSNPTLLIADEPTGNLDPETGRAVLATLERVNAAGTTVLMSTHDRNLVNDTRHRVVVLEGGRIVRDDHDGGYESRTTDHQEA